MSRFYLIVFFVLSLSNIILIFASFGTRTLILLTLAQSGFPLVVADRLKIMLTCSRIYCAAVPEYTLIHVFGVVHLIFITGNEGCRFSVIFRFFPLFLAHSVLRRSVSCFPLFFIFSYFIFSL